MTKAVAVKKEGDKLAPYTQEQIELIKRTVAKGATNDELALFLVTANRCGLDPFTKQVHFIKYGNNAGTIVTGIDGYRVVAQRSGEYRGQTPPQWCGTDGIWKDVWLANTPPAAARAGVWRAGFQEPIYAIARWSAYCPMPNGKPNPMWLKMGAEQLAKCAEALALRKAFPNDLSGLYTMEEMAQAVSDPGQPAKPVDPKAGTPAKLATLSPITLDFINKLNAANTTDEYNDVCAAVVEAKNSNAISSAEYTAILNAAKQAARRIEDVLNQPTVIEGTVEESPIPEEDLERIAKEVGLV